MADDNPTQSERIKKASRKRREEQKAETRQAIIDATSALFLKHGYEGFSLRQVAEKIGYSPGTIYLYFENKDDLLFTLADEGYRIFAETLQAAVDAAATPREEIMNMGRAYIEFGLGYAVHYRLMFMERPDFLMEVRENRDTSLWAESYQILLRSVQRALASGDIRPGEPLVLADTLWATLHGVVALAIRMPGWDPDERAANAIESIFELLRNGYMKPE